MAENLTKKELKSLKNALGKHGLTMEEHENAQTTAAPPLQPIDVDCFTFDRLGPTEEESAAGWHVGYGVQYNGVGVSAASGSSASSESGEVRVEHHDDDESSGFDSDPPTDDENPGNPEIRRESSDDVSDKGQLLHGVDEEFYVDKALTPQNVCLIDNGVEKEFKTKDFVTTNRFEVAKYSEPEDEFPQGYQMIGAEGVPCVTSHSEESDDEQLAETYENVTTSAGLWNNFVISPRDLDMPRKPEKLEIPEEKLKTIPLDTEKLAQISAAMANFKLPTPPGWEGVSDTKILDFIRQRI